MFSISKSVVAKLTDNAQQTNSKLAKRNIKSNFVSLLKEFGENISIHGIRYIPERNRSWLERVFWIVAIILSMCLCFYIIHDLWLKWNENPVIISLDEQLISVGTIPLPAITICPLSKISLNKFNYTQSYRNFYNLKKKSRNLTDEELKGLKVAAQICDEWFASRLLSEFPENDVDESLLDAIKEMSPGFEDTLLACSLMGEFSTCFKYFHDILTEDGVCYAFNLLSSDEILVENDAKSAQNRSSLRWNFQTGYEFKYGDRMRQEFPYRTFNSGAEYGFKVVLKILNENLDPLCAAGFQGFKISFHSPLELPMFQRVQYHVVPNISVNFVITPKVFTASSGIHQYAPTIRQCFFRLERHLKFFKIYTRPNCISECLSNLMVRECGCVRFTLPREKGVKNCGPAKINCCVNVERKIFREIMSDSCNCLPSCVSIIYDVRMFIDQFHLVEVYQKTQLKGMIDFENSTFSRITVSFRENQFRPMKRSELHSTSDFVAECGGLFGLFIGASLLSFIEIIYFFTLHSFYSLRKNDQSNAKRSNNRKRKRHIKKPLELFPYTP